MNDDWKPSHYKPRGGWRAMLPGWRMVLVALAGAGAIAVKMVVFDGWRGELSFNVMKIAVAIVAMACVAPHLFSGRPPPGRFPTERKDDVVRRNDIDNETP